MASKDSRVSNEGAKPEEEVSLAEKNGLHGKLSKQIESEGQQEGLPDTTRTRLPSHPLRETDPAADDLRNADLTNKKDLLAEQLAGKNLCGAKLPKDFKGFEETLWIVAEISKNCRRILLAILMVCAYCLVTIVTTPHPLLITNLHSASLPIMQSRIPIVIFHAFAPIFLLGLYIYFHLGLQRFWDELAALPAVFPDSRHLDQTVYPWLLNGYIRAQLSIGGQDRPPYSRLQTTFAIFIAWWTVPLTIVMIWWSYLPRHEWFLTSFHIIALVISYTCLIHFQCSARNTLRQYCCRPAAPQGPVVMRWLEEVGCCGDAVLQSRKKCLAAILFLAVTFWLASWAAVNFFRFADLTAAEISTKPANWTNTSENTAEEIDAVDGAKLSDTNLRGAEAQKAFLVKADLTKANLQKADLSDADLRKAFLVSAELQKAILVKADLRHANLTQAYLQDALLVEADLRHADLTGAHLNQAILVYAKLQHAKLIRADLQHAELTGAHLDEADFEGAELSDANLEQAVLSGADNLTVEQLAQVRTLFGAKLDKELHEQIQKNYPLLLQAVEAKEQ